MTDENLEDFDYLAQKGIKITAQMVPSEDAVEFANLLKISYKKGELQWI